MPTKIVIEPDAIIDALGIDREVVLQFVAVFSRFEYALKRSGLLKKSEAAKPDWDTFADRLRGTFRSITEQRFIDAVAFLTSAPPRRQVACGEDIAWTDTPICDGEHHEKYVLRLVRVVRNNLFHGGKYPVPMGPVEDIGRNRKLIEASVAVLMACLQLCEKVRVAFEETA